MGGADGSFDASDQAESMRTDLKPAVKIVLFVATHESGVVVTS